MNPATKAFTSLATVLFSTALLFSSPAHARPRSSRARQAPARTDRSRRTEDSRHALTLSIDLGRVLNRTTTSRRWVPGHYQTATEQVLVEPGHYEWRKQRVLVEPGHYEIRTLPPLQQIIRGSRGRARKILLNPACTEKLWIPARYEMRKVKVYLPPRYETRQVRVWVPGQWVSRPIRTPARSCLNLGAVFNFRF